MFRSSFFRVESNKRPLVVFRVLPCSVTTAAEKSFFDCFSYAASGPGPLPAKKEQEKEYGRRRKGRRKRRKKCQKNSDPRLNHNNNNENCSLSPSTTTTPTTAARRVGATIVLGDRPIEITLRRAWEGLSWAERLKLGKTLLSAGDFSLAPDASGDVDAAASVPAAAAATAAPSSSSPSSSSLGNDAGSSAATSPSDRFSLLSPPPSPQQVDALSRDSTSLAAIVASLDSELPALSRALVHERDEWLSWSLARSRAVCGAETVVGVLGAGHVRGVAWRLAQGDCRPRFAALAGVGGSGGRGGGRGDGNGGGKRRLSRKEMAVRRIAVEVGVAVALGLAWEAWKRLSG